MNRGVDDVRLGALEFQEFRDYLQEIAGIDLGDNKQYLVATRLRKVLADNGFRSLSELTGQIKRPANRQIRQQVIDVMTTNETFWFRDKYPFDYLKSTVLPEICKDSPGGKVRIWSAACSSGQEPFSLSMTADECMRENFSVRNLDVEIVATDVSSVILDQAKSGLYDRLSISRGLSNERLKLYFEKAHGEYWRAKPSVVKRISFRPLNLQENFITLGKFDVIFCRNVLIYFSTDLKRNILKRLHASLRPGGALFLGSSEGLSGASDYFDMVHCNPGVMYRAK